MIELIDDPILEGFQRLEKLIEQKTSKLIDYAKRPDSKDSIIQMNNIEIEELIKISEKIKPFKKPQLWRRIEGQVLHTYNLDNTLCGFQMKVIERPDNGRFAFLTLDLSQSND